MKGVILAAGKSTRTHPLTLNKPKALLKVGGKTLIERNMDELFDLVKEYVVVVGFKKKMIMDHLGKRYRGKRVQYVEQRTQLGTGHAVLQTQKLVKGRFILIMGDDLYSGKDLKRCVKHDYCVLVKEHADARPFGIWKVRGKKVVSIKEKPKKKMKGLVNIGAYVMAKKIFNHLKKVKKSEFGEYHFPDAIVSMAKEEDVFFEKSTDFWHPIPFSWNLLDANEAVLRGMKKGIVKGKVEKYAVLKGPVSVGEGTLIKSGAYIEGPVVIGRNCTIGPNCYIRPGTSIGEGCKVGNAVEIKNSMLYDNVSVGHLSYVGDSIIGDNTNIGAGLITANLRHDNMNVVTRFNDKKIDTGRRKFGTIIGDDVHTGIKTCIYPGRKIWPGLNTRPGQIIDKTLVK